MSLLSTFSSPWFLLLLPAVVTAVVLVSRRSLAGLGPTRRWISLGLRVTVVVLLVLALAETRLLWRNERLAVIFLLDRSASVPPAHQAAALDFARQASKHRDRRPGEQDVVGCVVFGRNTGIEAMPRARDLFETDEGFTILIERDVTDVQSAVRVAMAAFPEGYARRLVLISDGNENRGDLLEEARAAAREGVTIDVLSVRYSYPGEILVDKVVVDSEIHVGEPFDVRVVVDSSREVEANLRLYENGAPMTTEKVQLKEGKNVFTIPRRVDDASRQFFTYEAGIEALDREDDSVFQNNTAHAFTFIRGLPRVLLVSDEPSLDAAFVEALRAERIVVDVTSPDLLSSEVGQYLQYSSLVFSNIGAHQLSAEKMRLYESLVKGAGIGFVMIGGEQSFGAGGYLGSPIEELLPVWMDVKQKKTLPNGALCIIMHSCEINNGMFWAKTTAQQAIRVLSPQDYAGLLYYDGMGGESWLFPMMPCTKKGYMLNRLMGFNVGDMPDFARIFDMAHQGLKRTPAAIKHIIVFSDGDPSMPSDSKLDAIKADGITTSAICMGWHTSPANMQKLAERGSGNYYSLTGPDDLPEIFIREAVTVRKALIQERDFAPIVSRGGAFLSGIDLDSIPPLRGYVITSEKEAADHYLHAPPTEGDLQLDPLLSSWQYGLGKSVAFTSDTGRRWASEWGGWAAYQRFWGQLVRWVSKVQTDDRFRITHRKDGDRGIVNVDAIDPDGKFINDIRFEATVVTPGPDYTSEPIELRQIAPGRYRAEFDLGKEGNYLLSLKYGDDGDARIYTTGMVNPYSPEYRTMATNDGLLRRVADASGGVVLDSFESADESARAVFRRDAPLSRSPEDIWRSLLFLATVLFFTDVFVRRVLVDWAKLYRRARGMALVLLRRRARDEADPADERLGALLRKKAEVSEARESYTKFYSPDERERAPLDSSFDAGAAPPPESTAPREKQKSKAKAEQERQASEAESYTSRLLAAKRRALQDKEKKDGKGT